MSSFLALVVKDVKQLLRDPTSLTLVLLMPLAVMVMFTIGFGGGKKMVGEIPIAIVNLDRGPISWQFIEMLRGGAGFKIVAYAPTAEEGVRLVERGTAYAAIVIPEGFTNAVLTRKSTQLVVVVDAAYAMVSDIALQTAVLAVQRFMSQAAREHGIFNIEVVHQTVYGPHVTPVDMFTGVVMGVLLNLVPMGLIAVSISRERERKTFEQLIMTPISSWHIIIGKFTAYALITVADMVATLGLAVYVLGIRVEGPLPALTLVSLLLLLCSLGAGLLISSVSRNQLQAYQAAIFFFIPSIIFSGFILPVELMAPAARSVSRLLPLYYFLRAFRNVQLRGWELEGVAQECAALALGTVIFLAVAVRALRLRVE